MAKTPINGQETFPVTENDVYTLIETLAIQDIKNVKSTNRLDDAIYFYDVENGVVIEQALIGMAESQVFDKTKCDMSPKDPSVFVRYFNNYETKQYKTTTRRDDIRKIIANKGVGVEDIESMIVDSLTQGEGHDDFIATRSLILNAPDLPTYNVALGGTPASMKGILYAIRDMYEALRDDNNAYTPAMEVNSSTPESDIRVAISSKLLNLIDVTELANVFNLSKEELFGKIVVVPVSDLAKENWYKVVVYDRKAFGRATRIFDYDYDRCASGRYTNHFLTVERAYFYSPLFKAISLDVSAAATAELNKIITPAT